MKKVFRIISVLIIVSIICLSFSGCGVIEELRKSRINVNEKGNIEYNGKEYIRLENAEDIYIDYDLEKSLFLGKAEEPLLYSAIAGRMNFYSISTDGIFIDNDSTEVYCREDKYESVSERLLNGYEKERYIYNYDVLQEDEEGFEAYVTKNYELTEANKELIDTIFNTVEPITNATELHTYSDYLVEVYGCSGDLILREYAFDIFLTDGKYYLQREDEYHNYIVYEIPNQYYEEIKEIIAPYVKSYDETFAYEGW